MFHNADNMPEILKAPIMPLVTVFIVTLLVAFGIAWFYRNDYDPAKYIKSYLIYALPFLGLGLILHVRFILLVGIYILGFVILVFRNQHYFDR